MNTELRAFMDILLLISEVYMSHFGNCRL